MTKCENTIGYEALLGMAKRFNDLYTSYRDNSLSDLKIARKTIRHEIDKIEYLVDTEDIPWKKELLQKQVAALKNEEQFLVNDTEEGHAEEAKRLGSAIEDVLEEAHQYAHRAGISEYAVYEWELREIDNDLTTLTREKISAWKSEKKARELAETARRREAEKKYAHLRV